MAELWWPKSTRDEFKDCGVFLDGRPKGVLHTTEGKTYAGARANLSKYPPHFTVSWERGRFDAWQHIPISRAARALARDEQSPVQTNRCGAIQIEIVGYSDADACRKAGGLYQRDFPEGYLAGLAELMRWIEANAGVGRHAPPFLPYPRSYGANGIRFAPEQWRLFDGWCGHQHVPTNAHGDPGDIAIDRLIGAEPAAAPAPTVIGTRFPAAVHAAACPGGGTWVVGSDGGVGNYQGAPFHGSIPGLGVKLNAPVVAIVPHGPGGYWLVGADGGVFSFGDAPPIATYQPFFAEYGRGERRAVGAAAAENDGVVVLADDGAEYQLGRV